MLLLTWFFVFETGLGSKQHVYIPLFQVANMNLTRHKTT